MITQPYLQIILRSSISDGKDRIFIYGGEILKNLWTLYLDRIKIRWKHVDHLILISQVLPDITFNLIDNQDFWSGCFCPLIAYNFLFFIFTPLTINNWALWSLVLFDLV